MGLTVSSTGSSAKSTDEPNTSSTPPVSISSTMLPRPTHIAMPPSPFSNMNISYTPSPSHRLEDPFESPLISPGLVFYTAPSSPMVESPATKFPPQLSNPGPSSPPLMPVLHISIPQILPPSSQFSLSAHAPSSGSFPSPNSMPAPEHLNLNPSVSPPTMDEAFPEHSPAPAEDAALDDEGLSTLEKIYLFSRSKSSYHRVFIANALPELLEQVTPHEAIEYVLPLLNTLAMDEDEMVKEAFSSKLVTIIWWFFSHCRLIPEDNAEMNYGDDSNPPEFYDHEGPPMISVQAFTPILGTLLLSPNGIVGGAARYAVVALLERIKRVNAIESIPGPSPSSVSAQLRPAAEHARNINSPTEEHPEKDVDEDIVIGLFEKEQRSLFEKELLFQVVIGMGRLDVEGEDEEAYEEQAENASSQSDTQISGREAERRLNQEPLVEVVLDDESPTRHPKQDYRITSPRRETLEGDSSLNSSTRSDNIKAGMVNPYFPTLSSSYVVPIGQANTGSPLSASSSDSTASTPSSTSGTSASSSEDDASPHSTSSPRPPHSLSSSASTVSSSTVTSSPSHLQSDPDLSPLTRLSPGSPSPSASKLSGIPEDRSAQAPRPSLASLSQSLPQDSAPTDDFGPNVTIAIDAPSPSSDAYSPEGEGFDEGDGDQAAVGRLSSMSLMAAVAASGCLDNVPTDMFVQEIERVSQDVVYWVRREACFALGALAKIVPEEIVQMSLMPTFQHLVSDPVSHVRHSSLFALPTILSRLPFKRRRELALEVIVSMSMDESADVRAGVLEALGEVIHAFHTEDTKKIPQHFADTEVKASETPPEELLKMFLGRTQDRRVIDGQQPVTASEEDADKQTPPITNKQDALEAFYTDPSRPLICAFNFPAVTLTVGRERWPYLLRDTYIWLAQSQTPGVKRTLAASLGEMAKIIGPQHAQRDLLGVWRDALHSSEDDVRLKLVDSLVPFIGALAKEGREQVFRGLLDLWVSGGFTSWRAREGVAKSLYDLANVGGSEALGFIAKLLMLSLADSVNTVREAAIYILPTLWMTFKSRNSVDAIRIEFRSMARSEMSRRRMTYIACQHALLLPGPHGRTSMDIDDELCQTLASLASDPIIGVRIGVARLVGFICASSTLETKSIPKALLDVVPILSQDSSPEVRSYVADCLVAHALANSTPPEPISQSAAAASTFSRPPGRTRTSTSANPQQRMSSDLRWPADAGSLE